MTGKVTSFCMTIDWPDWRDKDAYSYIKNYSPQQWAWEFLRRNSEYQSSWNDFIESTKNIVDSTPFLKSYLAQFSKSGGLAIAAKAAKNNMSSAWPDGDNDDLCLQYFQINEIIEKSLYASHKWLLVDMLNPAHSLDANIFFNTPKVKSESGTERTDRLKTNRALISLLPKIEPHDISGLIFDDYLLSEPYILQITLDMRIPIGDIKKQVLREIERQYEEAKKLDFVRIDIRDRGDKYLLYLRTLDALRNGMSKDDIGKNLFARQYSDDIAAMRKQVSNTIAAAKKAQENYWQIAHLYKS